MNIIEKQFDDNDDYNDIKLITIEEMKNIMGIKEKEIEYRLKKDNNITPKDSEKASNIPQVKVLTNTVSFSLDGSVTYSSQASAVSGHP